MCASDAAVRIIEELEFLEAERYQLQERGPHFRIVHRYCKEFTPCGPHEEIAAVCLVHAGITWQIRLGTILSTMFDYMARHSRLAQTARQIERGTRSEYCQGRRGIHTSLGDHTAGIPRRYIKVYIERIRIALAKAIEEAGLDIDVRAVLVSQRTAMNETEYRLHGTFEWLHTAR